jgi:protocatechuate 3,4-dioxygenase beta subunit
MEKNRRDFLKLTGLMGAATLLPFEKILANPVAPPPACTLVPTETAGPFPLDLTQNNFYFRQDIRENKPGVQLDVRIRVTGDVNCLPMQNVRVNIWHCDKDGLYSGYDQTGNQGQLGLTYLRGYQLTDANGEVMLTTIFPGWYSGRICHIHFQVYVSSSYAAISQFSFDIPSKNAIYAANPTIYTKGADPTAFSQDNVFSDGYTLQLASLTQNAVTGGYDAFIEVTVQGTGISGVGHLEKQNAKEFAMGQNFPNPYKNETTIPVYLVNKADVKLDIYNLNGQKLRTIDQPGLLPGDHDIVLNLHALNLPAADYVYQLEVINTNGRFTDCKRMTAVR